MCLGYLYRRHELFHQFPVFLRILIAVRAGNAEPLIGFNIVLLNAVALVVQHSQIGLRPGVALFRRLLIPGQGLSIILRHALAVVILHAQTVLSPCISLLRRLAIPVQGFLFVFYDASAVVIAYPQVVLGIRIPLLSGLAYQDTAL